MKTAHDKLRAKDRALANDFVSDEEFDRLLRAWLAHAANALVENGLYFSQAIVWNKLHPVLTRKDLMGAFELAFYGWK